jgi:ABC-type sugar transport system substrate-binding protein
MTHERHEHRPTGPGGGNGDPLRVSRKRFLYGGLTAAGAVSLAPLIAACGDDDDGGGGGGGEERTVGFSFLYSEIPAAKVLKGTARQRADEVGYELLMDNIRGGAVDQQLQTLDSFFTRNVDAVVVHAVEPSSYGGQLRRAKDAGIPFITYATEVPGDDASILFPPVEPAQELGRHAAQYVEENFGGRGEVLLLTFTGDEITRTASRALGEALEAETGARVVARQDAVDQATALRVTEDTLEAHPDLNCVVCMADGGALGAVQAFKNAGRDPESVYIASNEGGQDTLLEMQKGSWIKAIEALSIRDLGLSIIDLPRQILEDGDNSDAVIGRELVEQDDKARIKELLADYNV